MSRRFGLLETLNVNLGSFMRTADLKFNIGYLLIHPKSALS
ncbi:hypothetical protein OROGR_022017 [Orobanche gracilis]